MPIQFVDKGRIALVSISDRFSMEDALEFGRRMKEALSGEWKTIIIVVAVTLINSHCLGTIFAGYREAKEKGKVLKLVCDRPHSLSALQRFDPSRSIPIFETIEEALSEDLRDSGSPGS